MNATEMEEGEISWIPPFALCEEGKYLCCKCEKELAGKKAGSFLVCWWCQQIYRLPTGRLETKVVLNAIATLEGWVVQQDGQHPKVLEALETLKDTLTPSTVRRACRNNSYRSHKSYK